MSVYRVDFEIFYSLLFFHPYVVVEANDVEQAIARANQVFNSNPDNMDLDKKIIEVKQVSETDYDDVIKLTDEMPWQPEERGEV